MSLITDGQQVRVWDIWVRIFHLSFALSVLFLLVSGETGLGFFDWHKLAGELVLALVFFRLMWGVVGSSNARLLSLFQPPAAAISHLRGVLRGESHASRGHNAAGGWAVLLMLLLVSVQAVSGLFIADEDELIEGAFYAVASVEMSEWMYDIHEQNAELLQILVIVHVAMVFFYLIRAKQNLIAAMISGKMHWPDGQPVTNVVFVSAVLGLFLMVVALVVAAVVFGWFSGP